MTQEINKRKGVSMKKQTFKYKLGDHVFILGKAGICIVNGRGVFNFISGGTINCYTVMGGQSGFCSEHELVTPQELRRIQEAI